MEWAAGTGTALNLAQQAGLFQICKAHMCSHMQKYVLPAPAPGTPRDALGGTPTLSHASMALPSRWPQKNHGSVHPPVSAVVLSSGRCYPGAQAAVLDV